MLRDNALVELRKKFEKAKKERDDLKHTLEKFQTSSKNLNTLLESQVSDKTGLGFDSQVFNSLVFNCEELHSYESHASVPKSPVNDSESVTNVVNVESSSNKPSKDMSKTLRPDAPIIENCKELASPKQMALSKDISNPFMAGVNTPRCDEDSLELMELMVFMASVTIKKVNDVVQLRAQIDGKKVVVTEDVIREDLHLDDADGVECLSNEEIFAELACMGYESPPPKLTFYKVFFSAQWKFLIRTLVQCVSAKRTVLNEFSCFMASAISCLATDDLTSHNTKYTSPTLTQKVFANIRRVDKGFSGVETPLFASMLVQPQPQAAEEEEDEIPTAPTPPSPTNAPSSPLQDPILTPLQAQPDTPHTSPPQE
nr:hypothetical protein [Tanacetum cinerariifolium]